MYSMSGGLVDATNKYIKITKLEKKIYVLQLWQNIIKLLFMLRN